MKHHVIGRFCCELFVSRVSILALLHGFIATHRSFGPPSNYGFAVLTQLLQDPLRDLVVPFPGLLSEVVKICFAYVHEIVLHKLDMCSGRLILKKPSSTNIGLSFVPGGFVTGNTNVGTSEPPKLDPSPLGLSMVLGTTTDNVTFQVSVAEMFIVPQKLISLRGNRIPANPAVQVS